MSTVCGKQKQDSEHPYLSGNFAPIDTTLRPTPCTYTGLIPSELIGGEYIRNGSNPVTNSDLGRDAHWFDGDGMLAGVLFQRSTSDASHVVPLFVNQYILTDVYMSAVENADRLSTPILPSITSLVSPFSSLAYIIFRILRSVFLVLLSHLPGSQQAIKRISVANTAILFHDGRALATCESGPPIRVQLPELETVGWYDGIKAEGEPDTLETSELSEAFGGRGLLSFMKEWTTGHPKVDPRTGEMVLFHCTFAAPYVHYSVIPAEASVAKDTRILSAPVPGCSGGKMMHDFGVSLSHTVILDLPLTLTPLNLLKNEPVVFFDPTKPSRFGVFPRQSPSSVQWFETEGCCIFHTANTWDETDETGSATAVSMLACRLTSASLVFSAGNLIPSQPVHRKDKTKARPMSFFAKYDEDQDIGDVEKELSDEKLPLLYHKPTSSEGSSAQSHLPPISKDDEEQCRLYYYRFSINSPEPSITHQFALAAIPFEFPTLNPGMEMSNARYIYGCSTSSETFGAALGKATKIDILIKADVHTLLQRGQTNAHLGLGHVVDNRNIAQILASTDPLDPIRAFQMPVNWYAQEARFVSRKNAASEDDGYLLFYAFDESQLDEDGHCKEHAFSELWILDARSMADVVARVRLPQRVPYGLHGNWFSEAQIRSQRPVEGTRQMPVSRKPIAVKLSESI
ncbi:carotenoid oxygenase [Polyplosphaeria fusca]|uniref:Carotenoid oxygenase n=1 Tax=Polyplosphaeria fusca TaxID=682080 RepID=A0A9P4QJ15_9PLEO|nr:carotenoid oxygenase [Polyplosphaeria fusca]